MGQSLSEDLPPPKDLKQYYGYLVGLIAVCVVCQLFVYLSSAKSTRPPQQNLIPKKVKVEMPPDLKGEAKLLFLINTRKEEFNKPIVFPESLE